MPEIPLYGQQKARTDALPATPYDQGKSNDQSGEIIANAVAGAAKGLTSAAAGVEKLQDRLSEEADAAAVFQAETDFERERNGLLFDQKTGYLTTAKGEAAVPGSLLTTQALNKAWKTQAEKLTTARQREYFAKRTQGSLLHTEATIEQHASREVELVKQQRYKALRDGKLNTIAAFASDPAASPAVFAEAAQGMQDVIRAEGARLGASPEATDRELAKFSAESAAVVLDGFLGGNRAADASAFFEMAKGDLGAEAPKYAAAIKRSAMTQGAQDFADSISEKAVIPGQRWLDWQKMRLDLDGIKDADVRKAVAPLVEHAIAIDGQMRAQEAHDQEAFAKSEFRKAGGLTSGISPKTWQYLTDPRNGPEAIDASERLLDAEAKTLAAQKRRANPGAGADKEQRKRDAEVMAAFDELASKSMEAAANLTDDDLGTDDADGGDARFAGASKVARAKLRTKRNNHKGVIDGGGRAGRDDAVTVLKGDMEGLHLSKNEEAQVIANLDGWYYGQVEERKGKNKPITIADVRANVGRMFTIYDSDGGTKNLLGYHVKRGYQNPPASYKPVNRDEQDSPLALAYLDSQGRPVTEAAAPVKGSAPSAPAIKLSKEDRDLALEIKSSMPDASNEELQAEFDARRKGAATIKVKTKVNKAADVEVATASPEQIAEEQRKASPDYNPVAEAKVAAERATKKQERAAFDETAAQIERATASNKAAMPDADAMTRAIHNAAVAAEVAAAAKAEADKKLDLGDSVGSVNFKKKTPKNKRR